MLSHYGRQKSGRQTHAKQNIFKICKLFKRLIDVIFDNDFTLHFINTFVKSRAWEKPFFSQLGHLSSAQRNAKHNGQLKKVILNCGDFFFRSPKYFYFLSRAAFANNDLRLKKVGDFEVQTLF